jgi:DNA-binding SARP family transcriptional activator
MLTADWCKPTAHGEQAMSLSLELLGRSRVLSDGCELALSRQSVSFLAYLMLNRDVDHPRDVLIEQFWSSCDPARGRSCLGTALSRLRKTLKIDGLLELSPRGEPRIACSAPIWSDTAAFEDALRPALAASQAVLEPPLLDDLIAGLTHYRGDLLPGWYDNWVLPERERFRVLCLRGYRRLMEHFAALGDLENAISAGQSALRIEPMQELIQQRVMELYHLLGHRAAAIRQYERLATLLKEELGIAPSKTTRCLIERIRTDQTP